MDRPAAIRTDNNPFGLTALFSPPLMRFFLPFLRWTSSSCPHCHTVFRRDFWPYNVRLGNGSLIVATGGSLFCGIFMVSVVPSKGIQSAGILTLLIEPVS